MTTRVLSLVLSLTLASSALLRAQNTWAPSAEDCAEATQTLTSGSLAQVDSQAKARNIIGGCGAAGAQAYATGMSRRRTAPLSPELTRYFLAPGVDTAIMRSALALATDPGASTPVRGLSLRTLLSYVGGWIMISYEELTSASEGDACSTIGGMREMAGTPLSATQIDAVKAAVAPLERSASEPAEVRSAASCVMNAWRRIRGLPGQPIATISPSTLQITYLCGNRFRIRNTAVYPVDVQWRLGEGTLELLHVMPADPTTGYGDTILDAGGAGTVQLLFDSDVIGSATNSGVVCSG
jgi:hypothetical protein